MQKVGSSEIAKRVTRALDMVRLGARADARPSELSGGMQQRVALARALVNEPEVLLLDEPLGALDLKLRQAMQFELKDLQERVGITFIYVTHDQEEALTMSDRIGVMSDAKLLQVGTPEEIYERPTSRFVADFIGEINLLEATVIDDQTVKLLSGTHVRTAGTGSVGSGVTVAIRPERFSLSGSADIADGASSLSGTVKRRTYFGDVFYYEVDTPAGVVDVKEENRPGLELFQSAARRRTDRILTANGWLVFAFLYVPIIVVIIFSFTRSSSVGVWGGFTFRWYDLMFRNEQLMNAMRNSVVVAMYSTVVSTVLGTGAALALDRYRKWTGRSAFDGLLYLPVIIPDVTMAIMLLMWFSQTRIVWPPGIATITLSHIAFNISFVAIVVRARLAHMDPAMEDAAADLYANRWQAFRRVTLPLIMPGVMGGALLALTLSLDDVVIASLVQGPGSSTLPVYVFGLIRKPVTPVINAVSTVMVTASMILVFASLAMQRRGEK